jgi:hypothetical protein
MMEDSDFYDNEYDTWIKPGIYPDHQVWLENLLNMLSDNLKVLIESDQKRNGWAAKERDD